MLRGPELSALSQPHVVFRLFVIVLHYSGFRLSVESNCAFALVLHYYAL